MKIIDGKRYNTTSSEHVYHRDNGRGTSDFRYRSKDLYRTKNGAWFMRHAGGPMTDMAISVGTNSFGGSADIEAVSADDAYGFLQAHSTDDQAQTMIARYFSDRVIDA